MQAVILCGGLGTRLKKIYKNKPKALIKFNKIPNLDKIINDLFDQGFTKVLLLTSFKHEEILNAVKKNKFYKKIKIIRDSSYFGTGGAIVGAKNLLNHNFLVILGDLFISFDYKKFFLECIKKKYKSNIVIHPNSHPFDSDTVSYDSNNKIINFYFKNKSKIKPNNSIAGIFFMNKEIIKSKYSKKKLDLVRDILKANKKNYCYKTIEFIKDYGTPERIANIKKQLIKNKINNYKKKKIAVFFDRDGVINKEVGVINKFNEFKILRNAIKAIKLLNLNNIPCFLVSNQASLSRKKIKFKVFNRIHSQLENSLSFNNAYLDDYSYCPNFGKKKFFRIDFPYFSNYRKPDPGMLHNFEKKYNINLKKSFFIGDRDIDVLTGKKVGCKTYLVNGPKLKDYKFKIKPDFFVNDALDAVNKILKINEI